MAIAKQQDRKKSSKHQNNNELNHYEKGVGQLRKVMTIIMSHEYIMKPNEYIMKPNKLHKTLRRNAYEYSHLYITFSSKN